ncbi:MAG TPA: sigma-54 dependent transcriptional regulator [Gemmatimonadales bacterium]|jgi:DNA-binding NtrC family response regulator|nr:sigma-54 dependent transcriptional regulator [Gemmatimonadales bacterium]
MTQLTLSSPTQRTLSRPARPAPDAAAAANIRVLVVDDEDTLRESCASLLADDGYNVTMTGVAREAQALLRYNVFDVLLLDWYMSEIPGAELLPLALAANPQTRVIAVTGKPTLASSLEAMRIGAFAYLAKPFSAMQLALMVGQAAHATLTAREALQRSQQLEQAGENSDKIRILGLSPAFRGAIARARKVAPTDASVLLSGESGAGKELFAQFIHHHSHRASRPFLALNCAALPEPLLESEMFGHRRGAFTGAIRDKPGLLEAADGGTLMLDELIEMPKPVQAKLLRAIQDGVVRRVGSETADAVVNVRFIAATNREPEKAVVEGALREDLYYRLSVVPIHVPSLRDRTEDVELLATSFLAHYWRKYRGPDIPLPSLGKSAIGALQAHPWPGNVRELQNVIEQAVVFLEPATEVRAEDLPFPTIPTAAPEPDEGMGPNPELGATSDGGYYGARDRLLAKFERQFLTRAIVRAGGNLSKAARQCGIDRTTFYRLMERHGLQRDES